MINEQKIITGPQIKTQKDVAAQVHLRRAATMSAEASTMHDGELCLTGVNHNTPRVAHVDTKKGPPGKRADIGGCYAVLLSYLQWDFRGKRRPNQGTTSLYTLRQILSIITLQEQNGPKGHSYCCVTYQRLAELTGQSIRTVKRHVARLIEWGYLKRRHRWRRRSRTQRSNLYTPGKRMLHLLARIRGKRGYQGDNLDTHKHPTGKGVSGAAERRSAASAEPTGENRRRAPIKPSQSTLDLIKRTRKLLE